MPDAPFDRPTATVLALGYGQVIAFACSFYLMGVLGDAIAADLVVSTTFVFALVSLSLEDQRALADLLRRAMQ